MTSPSPPPLFTPAFLKLMGAHFLQSLGFTSMLLLPGYLDFLGATRAQVGLVMSSAAVGGLLTRPAVGPLLDRWGRKHTLVAGTLMLSLGMLLLGLVDRVGWLVVAARILIGVGMGAVFTGYFTFASDLIPEARRTEGLALFGVSGLVALLGHPIVARLGVDAPTVRWFLPGVGLAVLLSLVLLHGVPNTPTNRSLARLSVRDVWTVLRARPLWSVWLADAVFSALVAVFMAFALVVADQRGLPHSADLWMAYGMGAIGVRVAGARLPDRLGAGRLLALALTSYLAGVWILAGASTTAHLLGAGALAGFGHGYCFPILTSQVVSRSPQHVRGSALSMFTGVWDFTKLCVPPLLGLVADQWDDATMLRLAVVVGVGGMAGWAWLERGAHPPVEPVPQVRHP